MQTNRCQIIQLLGTNKPTPQLKSINKFAKNQIKNYLIKSKSII